MPHAGLIWGLGGSLPPRQERAGGVRQQLDDIRLLLEGSPLAGARFSVETLSKQLLNLQHRPENNPSLVFTERNI